MPARASRHAWIGQADSHANPPGSSTDPEWALLHAAGAGLLRSISEAMKGSTTVHPLRATPVPVVLTILWDRDISLLVQTGPPTVPNAPPLPKP